VQAAEMACDRALEIDPTNPATQHTRREIGRRLDRDGAEPVGSQIAPSGAVDAGRSRAVT
jgi:hypothetical protein